MPKGCAPKPDFVKANERPAPNSKQVLPQEEQLSPVDKGKDYVKPGERA